MRILLAFCLLALPPFIGACTPRNFNLPSKGSVKSEFGTFPKSPIPGIEDFRGLVVDQDHVKLTWKRTSQGALPVVIRRLELKPWTERRATPKYLDALQPTDGEVVLEGQGGEVEFEDRSILHGRRYAYWIGTSVSGPFWGPVLLNVVHPDVRWPVERIDRTLDALAQRYPDLVKVAEMGHSRAGHPIRAILVGRKDRAFGSTGQIHAAEFGAEYLAQVAQYLVERDPDLLKEAGFVCLPLINVDRYRDVLRGFPFYVRKSHAAQKTVDSSRGFPVFVHPSRGGWVRDYLNEGVDLNRNHSALWTNIGRSYGHRTDNPEAGTYRGPAPFSEPETRAILRYFTDFRPLANMDLHEGRGGLLPGHTEDRNLQILTQAVARSYLNGFLHGLFDPSEGLPDPWVQLRWRGPERWPGTVSHFGMGEGAASLTVERHQAIEGTEQDLRFDDFTQTAQDVRDMQERHYRATREVMRLLAGKRKTVLRDAIPALLDTAEIELKPEGRLDSTPLQTRYVMRLANPIVREAVTAVISTRHGEGAKTEVKTLVLEPGDVRHVTLGRTGASGLEVLPLPVVDLTLRIGDVQQTRRITSIRGLEGYLERNALHLEAQALSRPVVLDGQLKEDVWRQEATFDRLLAAKPPFVFRVETRCWVAWDHEALYAAFQCQEPEMAGLKTDSKEHDDPVYLDDSVELLIDANHDRRSYVQLVVNADGVVYDAKGFKKKFNLKSAKVATSRFAGGWTAEIRIPWSDLGMSSPSLESTLGLLVGRNRPDRSADAEGGAMEILHYPLTLKGNHRPGSFATLELLP